MHKSKWQIIGKSIRGAAHIRKGLPNQDAIRWYSDSESGLPMILAISDGHGSKKCFRSDRGSHFAVDVAVSTIKAFVEAVVPYAKQTADIKKILQRWEASIEEKPHPNEETEILEKARLSFNKWEELPKEKQAENLTIPKRIAEEQLPKEIVRQWKKAVEKDIQKDLEGFENLQGLQNRGLTETAYGATLLTVLVTEAFIIYLQLGDGDILTVWEPGNEPNKVEPPMPPDSRLFANETTSLCARDAWRDFRFYFQPILDSPPRLILLATDGYANSFKDDENFFKVALDILQMIETKGSEFVEKNLENWLNQASQAGSGDDITIGLIFCGDSSSGKFPECIS